MAEQSPLRALMNQLPGLAMQVYQTQVQKQQRAEDRELQLRKLAIEKTRAEAIQATELLKQQDIKYKQKVIKAGTDIAKNIDPAAVNALGLPEEATREEYLNVLRSESWQVYRAGQAPSGITISGENDPNKKWDANDDNILSKEELAEKQKAIEFGWKEDKYRKHSTPDTLKDVFGDSIPDEMTIGEITALYSSPAYSVNRKTRAESQKNEARAEMLDTVRNTITPESLGFDSGYNVVETRNYRLPRRLEPGRRFGEENYEEIGFWPMLGEGLSDIADILTLDALYDPVYFDMSVFEDVTGNRDSLINRAMVNAGITDAKDKATFINYAQQRVDNILGRQAYKSTVGQDERIKELLRNLYGPMGIDYENLSKTFKETSGSLPQQQRGQ